MSCVKYCVFAFPRGHLTVQTPVGVKRALRYPRPRRGTRRGSYIGASVASDVAIAPNHYITQSNQWWYTIFVGWVGGTPEHFLFFALSLVPCLILSALSFFVALLNRAWFCLSLSPCPVLFFVARFRFPSLSPYLFLVCLAFPRRLVHAIHTIRKHALHNYALFIHLVA